MDMTLASVEGLAELDAQLRRQGTALEERREKLLMKFITNSMGNTGSAMEAVTSMTLSGGGFDPERLIELSQSVESIGEPKKLMTLLQGDMTEEQVMQKMMATPEFQAVMQEMRQRFEGLGQESNFDLPELHEHEAP